MSDERYDDLAAKYAELRDWFFKLEARVSTLEGRAVLGLAVEPEYDLKLVPALIPCTPRTLRRYLTENSHLFPPKYRLQGPEHRRIRVLDASEVRSLRELMRETARPKRKLTGGPKPRSPRPIEVKVGR